MILTQVRPLPAAQPLSGLGLSGKDYCYVPPPGELVLVGDNYSAASAFPLGECEGDCDQDSNCKVRAS